MTVISNLTIESVDLDAQGLARHEGKVVFIENALLGEKVDVEITRNKSSYSKGHAIAWHRESAQRVVPKCPHYGVCGGCAMQHVDAAAQLAIKQRVLEDHCWHLARLRPQQILAPLDGSPWGYRTKARLTARFVAKKGGMLLGFHERKSSFVAVMDSCEILPPRVSEMLPALRDCIGSLSIAQRLPQAELAVGEPEIMSGLAPDQAREQPVIVWVLRILEPLTSQDEAKLREFADLWKIQFWLQPAGPASAKLFYPPDAPQLAYHLPEFNLRMPFSPVDFTQVNPGINQVMVRRAIDLLDPQPTDRVADFFCGLGNFTLALARRAGQVVGIDGSKTLTDRALRNAEMHQLQDRVQFDCLNLFEVTGQWLADLGRFDRILIDPPREGAQALCQAMVEMHQAGGELSQRLPSRMVYVSCNPATLARDLALLVHQGGWALSKAGVINMFPQTAHVESIAVLDRAECDAR
jgi:23S rRNA (uracil1939-C5)-methyltransferase